MKFHANRAYRAVALAITLFIAACANNPPAPAPALAAAEPAAWSINRVVNTDNSMITLFDPFDLAHHESDPDDWYLHDFAFADDIETGRFAAVLTDRSGQFDVRITTGELYPEEAAEAGPKATVRLRVVNHRLLLSGGEAWPSVTTSSRKFAYDNRWIGFPNGDYGVIITALNPAANSMADYVIQLIKVDEMAQVKFAPGIPQLIYGDKAAVVGVNATGFHYNENCADVPGTVEWAPLVSRHMPIPGATEQVEIPRSMHQWAISQQKAGSVTPMPMVLARNPQVGGYGVYIRPDSWNESQLHGSGQAVVKTRIRCAVQITSIVGDSQTFKVKVKPIPTPRDRLQPMARRDLKQQFERWAVYNNDPAWRFKTAKVMRTQSDSALILGIIDYLDLISKDTETLLPLSNRQRLEYVKDRIQVRTFE